MAWATVKGWFFRATGGSSFTNYREMAGGTGSYFYDGVDPTESYPQTPTIGGETVTCGFTAGNGTGQTTTRDRTSAGDVRFDGCVVADEGGATFTYQVDLPATGDYKLRIARGDAAVGLASGESIEIYDNATLLHTYDGTTTSSDEFEEADDVVRAAASATLPQATFTFATTTFRIKANANARLAFFELEQVVAGGSGNPWYAYAQQQ